MNPEADATELFKNCQVTPLTVEQLTAEEWRELLNAPVPERRPALNPPPPKDR